MTDGSTQWLQYQKRIRTVIEYIHENPGENLTSDLLAEVAHLSPYHWHRIYKSITGESAVATVKRCRMHNAAAKIIRTDTSLAEVGASVGYPEVHSFNRTFKQFYGITPGKFRTEQMNPDMATESSSSELQTRSVELQERPAVRLVGLWHYGDFMNIGLSFEKVMAQMAMAGIMPENPQMMGLYLADPECTKEPELRSFAGTVIGEGVNVPDELAVYDYPGGRFAVHTHHGSYALLSHGYDWLYSKWLPSSGESVRDQPCGEVYLNSPVDTAQTELLTEICLPLG